MPYARMILKIRTQKIKLGGRKSSSYRVTFAIDTIARITRISVKCSYCDTNTLNLNWLFLSGMKLRLRWKICDGSKSLVYGQEIVGSFTSLCVATVPRRHWETNGGGYHGRGESAAWREQRER